LTERICPKLIPLAEVPIYVPVSRTGIQKRMKSGGLTAFCFHVTRLRSEPSGRTANLRRAPYVHVPVAEAKAWAEEIRGREAARKAAAEARLNVGPESDRSVA